MNSWIDQLEPNIEQCGFVLAGLTCMCELGIRFYFIKEKHETQIKAKLNFKCL